MTFDDSTQDQRDPTLSPLDEQAVDLLVEHGFDLERATAAAPTLRERLAAAHAVFHATESYPVAAPDAALIDATLARIDREEDAQASRMRFGATVGDSGTGDLPSRGLPSLGRGRWADFVAVACVAILVVSIGLPILDQMEHRSAVAGCANNMRSIGAGLAQYHGDFNSRPIAAGFAPDLAGLASWAGYDNSKHLDVLHQKGYCDRACLSCANNDDDSGYASQVPNERLNRLWMMNSHLPLLADRNPLVLRTAFGRPIGALAENSLDHGGTGQNILFADLTVGFEGSPLLSVRFEGAAAEMPENIWIPADRSGIEVGLQSPRDWSALDVFLLQ